MEKTFNVGDKVRGEWHGDGDDVYIAEGIGLDWAEVYGALPPSVLPDYEAIRVTKLILTNVEEVDDEDFALFAHNELKIIVDNDENK